MLQGVQGSKYMATSSALVHKQDKNSPTKAHGTLKSKFTKSRLSHPQLLIVTHYRNCSRPDFDWFHSPVHQLNRLDNQVLTKADSDL